MLSAFPHPLPVSLGKSSAKQSQQLYISSLIFNNCIKKRLGEWFTAESGFIMFKYSNRTGCGLQYRLNLKSYLWGQNVSYQVCFFFVRQEFYHNLKFSEKFVLCFPRFLLHVNHVPVATYLSVENSCTPNVLRDPHPSQVILPERGRREQQFFHLISWRGKIVDFTSLCKWIVVSSLSLQFVHGRFEYVNFSWFLRRGKLLFSVFLCAHGVGIYSVYVLAAHIDHYAE